MLRGAFFKPTGIAFILVAIAILGSASSKAADPPQLFERLDKSNTDLTPNQEKVLSNVKKDKTAVEYELIKFHEDAFAADDVSFDLAPNKQLHATKTRKTETKDGKFVWSGLVEEQPNLSQNISFVVIKGKTIGSFKSGDYIYNIRPLGNGVHILIKRDPKKLPPDHPKEFEEIEKAKPKVDPKLTEKKATKPANGETSSQADSPPTITVHVLVAYTPEVKLKHGDTNEMNTFIQGLIALTNTTYSDSKIPIELQLAHAVEVNYTESGSVAQDLTAFRVPGDGKMDEVHTLRDSHDADIAMLLISDGDAAGYASAIPAIESTAFALADDDYTDWYFTFAHEIGHLMGARHDWDHDGTSQPGYNHGYQNALKGWRTIMAYNCDSGCTRQGIWSNPNITWPLQGGDPAGTTQHNNARMLSEMASIIAAFR